MKRMVNNSECVNADSAIYEYTTPEQSEIIDKINVSNSVIAGALINAYKQKNTLSGGEDFCAGQIQGMAFACWQMGIIRFSEYNELTDSQ